MSSARLSSSVVVSALIRKAEADGGFAAVLGKGDAGAGAILLLLAERGGPPRAFERILRSDGAYSWEVAAEGEQAVTELSERRRRFDPDLWVVELNVPAAERFAAEMNDLG